MKDARTNGEVIFGVDDDNPNSRVPFRYPDWQEEKPPEEQAREQPKPKVTPYYAKYMTEQEKYPNSIVIIRLGNFYEMMGKSAEIAATELELTLTGRNVGIDGNEYRVSMCGVPFHATDNYIEKLLKKHSVAVIGSDIEKRSRTYKISRGIA